MAEQLHGALVAAFLENQQRTDTFVRRGFVQVDENNVGVLVGYHVHEPRAVRELDNIDVAAAQFLGKFLPEHEVGIHEEAERIGRSARLRGHRNRRLSVDHGGFP